VLVDVLAGCRFTGWGVVCRLLPSPNHRSLYPSEDPPPFPLCVALRRPPRLRLHHHPCLRPCFHASVFPSCRHARGPCCHTVVVTEHLHYLCCRSSRSSISLHSPPPIALWLYAYSSRHVSIASCSRHVSRGPQLRRAPVPFSPTARGLALRGRAIRNRGPMWSPMSHLGVCV